MTLSLDQLLTPIVIVVFALAIGVLVWGYQRAKPFGKLGRLAWWQSVALIAPWLLYFVLFSLGLSLSLPVVLLLLLLSGGIYIYLGRQLRAAGQEEILRQKAAQRLQALTPPTSADGKPAINAETTPLGQSSDPDALPIPA
ncbi:MAG: hypothetical protein ACO36E_10240, partial [Synechocystis sp.]